MSDRQDAYNTPEEKSSPAVRIVGTAVIIALLLAIVLLALGVVNFEASGWFN